MIAAGEVDALDALDTMFFDVIIIDVETLGFGSAQLVKLVNVANLGSPPLPIIAITNDVESSMLSQLADLGIEAILTKPVSPQELLSTLVRVIHDRASSSNLE